MSTAAVLWSNETYAISVIANPSTGPDQAPKVYAVTNRATGIDELYTMQLPQAFVYAVQSEETIAKAKQLAMANAAPFQRTSRQAS